MHSFTKHTESSVSRAVADISPQRRPSAMYLRALSQPAVGNLHAGAAIVQRVINVPAILRAQQKALALIARIYLYNQLPLDSRTERLGMLNGIRMVFEALKNADWSDGERTGLEALYGQIGAEEQLIKEAQKQIAAVVEALPASKGYGEGATPDARIRYLRSVQDKITGITSPDVNGTEKGQLVEKHITPAIDALTKEKQRLAQGLGTKKIEVFGDQPLQKLVTEVQIGIAAYNEAARSISTEDSLMQRQSQLNALEGKVHTAVMLAPGNASIRKLLNEIQKLHLKVIGKVATQGDEIATYVQDDKKPLVQAYWQKIVNGTGKILISETDHLPGMVTTKVVAGFRNEALQALARLLRQPTGLTLIGQIMDGGKKTTIVPLTDQNTRHVSTLKGGSKIENMPAIAVPDFSDSADYQEAHRRANYKRLPPMISTGENQAVPGEGIDTFVLMKPGFQDAELYTDKNLVTPVFIALGHELVHAKHNATGTAMGTPPQVLTIYWNYEKEETHTIKDDETSENRLRADYGLGRRETHEGGFWEAAGKTGSHTSAPRSSSGSSIDLSFSTSLPSSKGSDPFLKEVSTRRTSQAPFSSPSQGSDFFLREVSSRRTGQPPSLSPSTQQTPSLSGLSLPAQQNPFPTVSASTTRRPQIKVLPDSGETDSKDKEKQDGSDDEG